MARKASIDRASIEGYRASIAKILPVMLSFPFPNNLKPLASAWIVLGVRGQLLPSAG